MMTSTSPTDSPTTATTSTPGDSGYADVNGLHLYWERYGAEVGHGGTPLLLLHGGLMTIDLNFATLIPTLARSRTVIGAELQGHGRTGNIDRVIDYPAMASDVVGLLDHLGIDQAVVLGHSFGGGVAMELAVSHPDRVRAIIPISITLRAEGSHPDLADPSTYATSSIMPTQQDFADMSEAYARLSPHPEKFQEFMMSMSGMSASFTGWTDEQLAGVRCPVLIVQGDNDFTLVSHAGFMLDHIPGSELAVLPATTHMQVTRRASILLPILAQFFADHDL